MKFDTGPIQMHKIKNTQAFVRANANSPGFNVYIRRGMGVAYNGVCNKCNDFLHLCHLLMRNVSAQRKEHITPRILMYHYNEQIKSGLKPRLRFFSSFEKLLFFRLEIRSVSLE